MDIEMIQAFTTLVEYKNFTKAADILCISQSALSHRLNTLELELGETLIIRNRGKRVFYLTQAGSEFIPLAEQWLALYKTTQNFKELRKIKTITISNIETLTNVFGKLYQQISSSPSNDFSLMVNTYTFPSPHIISEVENQNLDVGFVVRQRISRNLKIEPIFKEPLLLLGALGSDKQSIDPRTLDPHKELITDWYTDYRPWHDFYLGTASNPFAIVDTATMAVNFITDGIWCIVPQCSADFLTKNCALNGVEVRTYEMPNPPPPRTCYKVTHRFPAPQHSESIRYFEEKLTDFLAENNLHL